MPTRTIPRTPGRFERHTTGRFGVPRSQRPSPSRKLSLRRTPAPRSRADRALSRLGALGRKPPPSAGHMSKGRKAGMALLAGAAGFALNRRRRRKAEEPLDVPTAPVTPPPGSADPVAVEPDPLAPSTPEPPTR